MGALGCTQLSRINEDKRNRWMQNGVPIFVIVLNTIWCVHLTRFGLERFAADLPAQDWSWLLNWQTICNCEHYSLYKTAWPHTGAPWYNDTTQSLDHKRSSQRLCKSVRIWKLQAPWLITELLNHLWKSLSVGMIVSRLAACGGATAGAPACLKHRVSGPSGGQMPQSSSNAQSSCNCLNDAQTVAWGTDRPTSNYYTQDAYPHFRQAHCQQSVKTVT